MGDLRPPMYIYIYIYLFCCFFVVVVVVGLLFVFLLFFNSDITNCTCLLNTKRVSTACGY